MSEPKPGLRARLHTAPLLKQLGPGLITGAADDDPSGIATYSQGGAQFGFNLLWTLLLTFPLMAAIQMVSALIGRVTGRGLAYNMGQVMPRPLVLTLLVALLFIANTINVGADLAAMGEAAKLVTGLNQHAFTIFFAAAVAGAAAFHSLSQICPLPDGADLQPVRLCRDHVLAAAGLEAPSAPG